MKRLALIVALVMAVLLSFTQLAIAEPVQDWTEFKAAFEKAAALTKTDPKAAANQVDRAKQIYVINFEPAVTGAQSVKARVLTGLAATEAAAERGDALAVIIEGEITKKTSLALFFSTFESYISDGKVNEAGQWFGILAAQLKLAADDSLVKDMQAAIADPQKAKNEGKEIVEGLTGLLVGKVAEEIDEALVLADPKNADRDPAEANVKAAEGIGYFRAVEAKIISSLGSSESAKIGGLVDQVAAAITDGNYAAAVSAGNAAKEELAEMEPQDKLSGTAFLQGIDKIKVILANAEKAAAAGNASEAMKLGDEGWAAFHKIEGEIRRLDVARYVAIEKVFPRLQENPKAADARELTKLFTAVAAVKSGKAEAATVTLDEMIVTSFENNQPLILGLLALLGIYPVYLIIKAFGWSHRAWRNIGIFIMLLIVPVFMEAIGRLGIELKINTLQSFSFMVSQYAKMAWVGLVLIAFLFAISGLRQFCSQFGIKAFGVRQQEDESVVYPDAEAVNS